MSDIPINPVTRRVQFTGNTGLGPFAFTFNIYVASDIAVYRNAVLLTLTTDYTVTIAANGTGSVTLTGSGSGTTLTLNDSLTIVGARQLARTTDFVTAGDLLAVSLNEQLDSNVIMSQQLDEKIDRSIKFDQFDTYTTATLPAAADRADKIIKFDVDGELGVASAADFFGNAVLGANYVNNTATGNGSQVAFGLTVAPGSKNNIQVYIDGVYQNKASFSISAATITFSEAPPLNSAIEFIIGQAVTEISGDSDSINYTQGGTGSQQRTLTSKLQESVSVKDFGATGDGVTDDTAAIQAAIDASFKIYFPQGTYIVSSTLSADKTGFKVFGESEDVVTIQASSGFTGSYLFNLGNGSVSRYFNEFRNVRLYGNSVASLVGIYFNRVNNQSKIMHCHFEGFHTAIKAENLALANTCCYNKFGNIGNTIDIHLVGAAGNSWLIMGNYFTGGGYVYLDDSMTDVKYVYNVGDAGSYLKSDGAVGARGIHVVGNRFEGGTDDHVQLGLVRGCYISDNFFQGNGVTGKAINLSSTSAVQYATVANNFFENYITNYVDSNIPNNRLELYGNHSNDSYSPVLEYNTNTTLTAFEHDISAVNYNVKGGGAFSIGSDEINFGPNKESLFILSKSLTGGGSTDNVLTITTDGTRGCYTIIADIMVSNTPNSAAVAAGHARFSWTHITDNGGNSDDSAVTTEKALVAIADAGGSRDITGLTAAVTTTSGTVSTFSLTCSTVGAATDVQAHCSIKMIYHQYSAQPAVAVV
jgi:hypothetical protein